MPLVALAAAQFVMVLDQSVMNVSISALVDDFDTTVPTIQAVITLYCLVMAMLMLTGAKIGDIVGRRRAFVAGLVIAVVAVLVLLATVRPDLAGTVFAVSMALLGVGMGLVVSQLGNVVQSSVDATGRSEAGGLQYTGCRLGSSLGVALIGAIVLAGLTGVFVSNIRADDRIAPEVSAQVGVAVESGVDFVATDRVRTAAQEAGLDQAAAEALVDDYQDAQIQSLKAGLLAAALLALVSLMFTRELPHVTPSLVATAAEP
ncbi:hypothetical protein GCM10014719_29980 [Planomonospora parontospora subsp. antibiotica]|nr:hypothetical protein GCM10014719_29980 [Planomonospora parontospora subsp. antibiotica]